MENANTFSLGSAMYAAKRAADVIFVLQNKDNINKETLAQHLTETLRDYGEKGDVAPADLDNFKTVADKICVVFTIQDTKEVARLLNTLLDEYASTPRLSTHGNTAWHLHVDSSDHAPWAEWFAASSTIALATLLTEKQRNPGGLCASPTCGRPFIDSGKGGGRSYCSPRCATRERVATHRKQERKQP